MRALFLENLKNFDNDYCVENESFHHLKNVLRVKVEDEVLCLDGNGSTRKSVVDSISKKSLRLKFIEENTYVEQKKIFSVALAQAKRDSLEISLKQLVEVGVPKIYIFSSEYSDRKKIKEDRINKILISALEQSNASYLPEIKMISFQQLLELSVDKFIYFSSQKGNDEEKINNIEKSVMIIGPEGGLSMVEEEKIANLENSITINLPTNILRASTASALCSGYLLGKLKN